MLSKYIGQSGLSSRSPFLFYSVQSPTVNNDFNLHLDNALQEITHILREASTNPSEIQKIQTLDFNYSAVLRVVIEVQKQRTQIDGEVVSEGKPETNSLRSQLLEIYRESGEMRVMIDWPHV